MQTPSRHRLISVLAVLTEVALRSCCDEDLQAVRERAKDVQYFRPGNQQALRLAAAYVPFGIADGGFDVSDHLGYAAVYTYY